MAVMTEMSHLHQRLKLVGNGRTPDKTLGEERIHLGESHTAYKRQEKQRLPD